MFLYKLRPIHFGQYLFCSPMKCVGVSRCGLFCGSYNLQPTCLGLMLYNTILVAALCERNTMNCSWEIAVCHCMSFSFYLLYMDPPSPGLWMPSCCVPPPLLTSKADMKEFWVIGTSGASVKQKPGVVLLQEYLPQLRVINSGFYWAKDGRRGWISFDNWVSLYEYRVAWITSTIELAGQ